MSTTSAVTKIDSESSCQTQDAKTFVIKPDIMQELTNIYTIGYTYSDSQTEIKLYFSREIRDKNGKRVKSLCILNALANTYNVTVNLVHKGVIQPKSTLKDIYLINVDDFGLCEKTIEIEFKQCTKEEIDKQIDPSKLEWARRIWINMYTSSKYHDAVIRCGDGQKYYLHRFALASVSPVLKAIFTHGAEAGNGILNVPDLDKPTLDVLVRYIYCGVTTIDPDLCDKVMAAADKYDLGRLKEAAEIKMCELADANNAIRYFKLAELYRLEKLKKKCCSIIATDDFIDAKSYETVDDVELLKNILKQRIPDKQE